MKKLIISLVFLAACTAGFAQKQMVVNTEKIFKSMPMYNQAIETMDALAKQYQNTIDENYASIEKQYNDYQAQKQYLTESARRSREDAIMAREKEVEEYQQQMFGQEGALIKKRIEIIKPIQDAVFAAINKYAATNGYTMVTDIASNPSVIYYAPDIDKTTEMINIVKTLKITK